MNKINNISEQLVEWLIATITTVTTITTTNNNQNS